MGIIEERLAASPDLMREFQRERLELELTELICELMEQRDVSRAELARRLGTSRAYVTKVLRDGSNMTVRTISDIFFSLGRSLRLAARPLAARSPQLLIGEVPHATSAAIQTEDLILNSHMTGLEFRSFQPQFTAPIPSQIAAPMTARPDAA